jgi:ubiquinone/menaquinone biosynthesis C-methylase UbiE
MNYLRRLLTFNASRYRLSHEIKAFAASVPSGASVLDAGSGDAPYKSFFQHTRYESADFEKVDKRYASSTYVCDLQRIPVEDGRFDFIILTQVLEHVPEPRLVLAELYRVLRPGGAMMYSAPLFYEEHEQPYDFYRYTQFGLRHLLGSAGFIIDRLDWLEGYFGTVGYQLNTMARYLPRKPRDFGDGIVGHGLAALVGPLRLGFALCSILFQRLETRIKFEGRGYPKNYVALAHKPQPEPSA